MSDFKEFLSKVFIFSCFFLAFFTATIATFLGFMFLGNYLLGYYGGAVGAFAFVSLVCGILAAAEDQ